MFSVINFAKCCFSFLQVFILFLRFFICKFYGFCKAQPAVVRYLSVRLSVTFIYSVKKNKHIFSFITVG